MTDTEHMSGADSRAALNDVARPTLADRYQIDPADVLDGLSRPGAKAYGAVDLSEPRRPIYAIVTNARSPYRHRAVHQGRQMEDERFTAPIRVGPVPWPGTARNETVLFLPRPSGEPLMPDLDGKIAPISQHRLSHVILPALAELLKEMAEARIPHRAIRPDNIFMVSGDDQLTVGECFSVPAGVGQPNAFEAIERAMCMPAGRGEGDSADDMFALGMTILVLALGQNPVAGMDDETLMMRRRHFGSYSAVVGKKRVPQELIQVLRALLRDDPAERWSVEDLLGWIENGRGTGAQTATKVEADRGYEFGEKKYKMAPTLALALGADRKIALEEVKAGKVDKWVERSLKDKRCIAAIGKCRISGANGPRGITDDLLLARILTALDPTGPLRYRDITVMPDGIGALMASLAGDEARLKQVVELLNGMLPAFWIDLRNRPSYAMFSTDETLSQIMPLLAQGMPGFGVERVLYELNPGLPCLSPLVLEANVIDLTPLLKVLDRKVAEQGTVIDRHIAAFVAARISGSIDRDLNDLSVARTPGNKLLAQLRLYSYVQGKSDIEELPGLCNFFNEKSPAILETYRNIPLRAKLAKAAGSAAESGKLSRLLKVLGNEKNRRWDDRSYSAVRKQYREAESNISALQASFATIPDRARATGRQIGAIAAGGLSMAVTLVVMMTSIS